jgi:hypothetical protein
MTLVSFRHNFIYLRTRKTASSSISMYLQPFCLPAGEPAMELRPLPRVSAEGIVSRSWAPAPNTPLVWLRMGLMHLTGRKIWRTHELARDVRDALDPAFWARALKITSVRNPFTRVVSSFYWHGANKGEDLAALPEARQVRRFRRMVREGRFHDDWDIVSIDGAFVPELLIRQEHLEEDLTALADRLGLDTARTRLPVTKKTAASGGGRPSYAALYDAATADIVRQRFDWAFTHGGYAREVPEG